MLPKSQCWFSSIIKTISVLDLSWIYRHTLPPQYPHPHSSKVVDSSTIFILLKVHIKKKSLSDVFLLYPPFVEKIEESLQQHNCNYNVITVFTEYFPVTAITLMYFFGICDIFTQHRSWHVNTSTDSYQLQTADPIPSSQAQKKLSFSWSCKQNDAKWVLLIRLT